MKRIILSLAYGLILYPLMLTAIVKERNVTNTKPNTLNRTSINVQRIIDGITPSQMVETIIGQGVTYSNVSYTGSGYSAGSFSNGAPSGINIENGIILSCGDAAGAIGPNNTNGWSFNAETAGDAQLSQLIGGEATWDACILEFDFIPVSENISFNFVLGSEEYPEYLNYHDVFGFFLDGENIAFLPGTTTPVSIGTVNHLTNSQYYISNDSGQYDIQCDGFTVVLPITAFVTPYQVHHIKLAVADMWDHVYDTWIFLEQSSFISGADVNLTMLQPPVFDPDGSNTYYIKAINTGPSTAQNTLAQIRIPYNFANYSVQVENGSTQINGNMITWTIGTMTAGEELILSVIANDLLFESLNFAGIISSDVVDPNYSNNEFPVYQNPVAYVDSYQLLEDTSLDISVSQGLLANDISYSYYQSSCSIIDYPDYASNFSITSTGAINYSPIANYYGTDSFSYTFNDGVGGISNEAIVTISIDPVNDTPVIDLPYSASFMKGNTLQMDILSYIYDVDSSEFLIGVSGNQHIQAIVSGTVVSFSCNNWVGTEHITVSVNDEISKLIATDQIAITVLPPLTCHDIQYTTDPGGNSPYNGYLVNVEGIVTVSKYYPGSDVNDYGYFIADAGGGAYSGLFVADTQNHPLIGDRILLIGVVMEINGFTQLTNISGYTLQDQNNTLPEPVLLNTSQLGSGNAEQWEGVLVKVDNAQITTAPDANGEFYIDDGTGICQIDDQCMQRGFIWSGMDAGSLLVSVQGVVDYENNNYGLNPRDFGDIIRSHNNKYTFSSYLGTYSEITGGTILGSNANDNECFNEIPLGFTFNYDGTEYDQISVQTNGFIAFGSSVLNTYTPLSFSSGVNNVVSAFSRDIKSRTNGSLSYSLSGSTPNRIFTIQWSHYRRTPTATQNDDFSFQIKLYENGNKIAFVYNVTNAITSITAAGLQVGLRFGSVMEFFNRSTSSDWSNTTDGTANNSVCNLSATVFPAQGLTFVFSPLEPRFTFTPSQGFSPLFVQFTDASLGNINFWEWDFNNDGIIDSNLQNPSYTYSSEGVYSVKLTIYDPNGNSAFDLKTDCITVQPFLLPNIVISPNSLSATMNPDTTNEQTLNISNNGNSDLIVNIDLNYQMPAYDLFISEYIEGSSNNKAIEVYNGTGTTLDLSAYKLKLAPNGGTWREANTLQLNGYLENGDVYVVCNPSANASLLALSDVTSIVTYFNGNDVIGLFKNIGGTDTLIDILGVYQVDPGIAWNVGGVIEAMLNHTLIRKPNVNKGTIDWSLSAGTTLENSQWYIQPINYIANLGLHIYEGMGNKSGNALSISSLLNYNKINCKSDLELEYSSSISKNYFILPQKTNIASNIEFPLKTNLRSGDNVLIFRDQLAWGCDVNVPILNSLGANITISSSEGMSTINFSQFDVIIIESSQTQYFYQSYVTNLNRFITYVSNGGFLQIHTASYLPDRIPNLPLPGGARIANNPIYDNYNYIADALHPIVAGLSSTLEGNSASHEVFENYPLGTDIITLSSGGLPTTIEYSYGNGKVLATGMCWEFNYYNGYNSGSMLPLALQYSLSYGGCGWLTCSPVSAIIPPGDNIQVTIVFDSYGMQDGTYTSNINICSNDSDTPVIAVPVTLTVITPVVPDFTFNPDSGLAPLTVQFTDLSSGIITNWAWDFNTDGIFDSNLQNPSWTYIDGGSYSVKLIIEDSAGNFAEIVKNDCIQIIAPCTSNIFSGTTNAMDVMRGNAYAFHNNTHYFIWSDGRHIAEGTPYNQWIRISHSTDGVNWTTENLIYNPNGGSTGHCLIFDAEGYMHILYLEETDTGYYGMSSSNLVYATNRSGTIVKTVLESIGSYGTYDPAALIIDPEGRIYAFYNRIGWYGYNCPLYERHFANGTWSASQMISNYDWGSGDPDDRENILTSIDYDADGNMILYISSGYRRLSYHGPIEWTNTIFKYKRIDGSFSLMETLPNTRWKGCYGDTEMSLDADGRTIRKNGQIIKTLDEGLCIYPEHIAQGYDPGSGNIFFNVEDSNWINHNVLFIAADSVWIDLPANESGLYANGLLLRHFREFPVQINCSKICEGTPLTAQVSASQTSGMVPFEVSFTSSLTGTYEYLQWNFGDGEISNEQNPTHIYNTPGTYIVTLSANYAWQYAGSSVTLTVNEEINPPVDVIAAEDANKVMINWSAPASKNLQGYKVWRLTSGDELNESFWTLLTANPIIATSFIDEYPIDLLTGNYKWAVKAIYSAGTESSPAFSNELYLAMQFPEIALSTNYLSETLFSEETSIQTFTISNLGELPLEFNIIELTRAIRKIAPQAEVSVSLLAKEKAEGDAPGAFAEWLKEHPEYLKTNLDSSNLATRREDTTRVLDWLSENPLLGTIPANSSMDITVTFNAIGLAVGTYLGQMQVESNDPYHPYLYVDIRMDVIQLNFTTDDNENNSHTGYPDYDMDAYTYNTYSNHPVEFNIFVSQTTFTSVQLSILAWDIDETSGEVDQVYLNGTYVGNLTGANNQWSTSVLSIDPSLINPGPIGINLVEIYVDVYGYGNWATTIDWGQLTFPEGPEAAASIRYVELSDSIFTTGMNIGITQEIDTNLSSHIIRIETNILDPNGINVDGASTVYTIHSNDDDMISIQRYVPGGTNYGIYNVQTIVYDNTSNLQQDILLTPFQVIQPGSHFCIDPPSLDLGTVYVTDTLTVAIQISNLGYNQLNISSISIANLDFNLSQTSFTIPRLESRELIITYLPTVETDLIINMQIVSNDVSNPTYNYAITVSSSLYPPPIFSVIMPEQSEHNYLNFWQVIAEISFMDPKMVDSETLQYRYDKNGNGIYDANEPWIAIPGYADAEQINVIQALSWRKDGDHLCFEFRAQNLRHSGWRYTGTNSIEGIADDYYVRLDATAPLWIDYLAGAGASAHSIDLEWSESFDSRFESYEIYYATHSGITDADWKWDKTDEPALALVTTTNTTISGLSPGIIYYFAIRARDSVGNYSDFSDEISYQTTSPVVVQNLQIEMVEGNIFLSWNTYSGASEYKIYIAENPDGPWELYATTTNLIISVDNQQDRAFFQVTAITEPVTKKSGN